MLFYKEVASFLKKITFLYLLLFILKGTAAFDVLDTVDKHYGLQVPTKMINLASDFDIIRRGPRKATKLFANVVTEVKAQIDTTPVLPCLIRNTKEFKYNVSWVKYPDDFQLTYSNITVTIDKRFKVEEPKIVMGNDNVKYMSWNLRIQLVNLRDEGQYQCCLVDDMEIVERWPVYLRVVEAKAEILGHPHKAILMGTTLILSCYIEDEYEDPEYIFWYHNDRMINFDMRNGINIKIGRLGSELVAPRAEQHHSGNYSCVPSNARPANVTVVVYKESTIPTLPPASKGCNNNNSNVMELLICFLLFYVTQKI